MTEIGAQVIGTLTEVMITEEGMAKTTLVETETHSEVLIKIIGVEIIIIQEDLDRVILVATEI